MKSFTLPMAFLATVGIARAQLSVSDCANMCLSNMLALASDLGCDDGDLECLCETPDYRYGIRDCTQEACAGDDAALVLAAALEQCPGESGGDLTLTPDPTTGPATGSVTATSTILGSDGSTTFVTSTGTADDNTTGTETTGTDSTATETGATDTTSTSGSDSTSGPATSGTPSPSPTSAATTTPATTTTLTTTTSRTNEPNMTSSGGDSESTAGAEATDEPTDAPTGAAARMAFPTGAAGALGLAAFLVL